MQVNACKPLCVQCASKANAKIFEYFNIHRQWDYVCLYEVMPQLPLQIHNRML